MLRVVFGLMFSVAVLAHAVPAQAYPAQDDPPPRTDPTAERHDGAYVRLYLGGGYLHSSGTGQGSTLTIHGPGVGFGVAVGGTVAENLIVYGEVAFLTAAIRR